MGWGSWPAASAGNGNPPLRGHYLQAHSQPTPHVDRDSVAAATPHSSNAPLPPLPNTEECEYDHAPDNLLRFLSWVLVRFPADLLGLELRTVALPALVAAEKVRSSKVRFWTSTAPGE